MTIIGLDLSLTGTGVTFLSPIITPGASGYVSHNIGTTPKDGSRLERYYMIAKQIIDMLKPNDIVFIEDYAWGAKGNLATLAELGGIVKMFAWRKTGYAPLAISQTRLKQWFSGGKTCKKEMIPVNVNKKYNLHFKTHDEYVSYALADLGWHLVWPEEKRELMKYELAVIEKINETHGVEVSELQALAKEQVAPF